MTESAARGAQSRRLRLKIGFAALMAMAILAGGAQSAFAAGNGGAHVQADDPHGSFDPGIHKP